VAVREAVPEVSLRLVLEAGASADPTGYGGLAELTARLLTEGAGTRDAVEMARWLDRLGAGFEASVSYDTAVLSMHLLSDVLDEALEFLSSATRDPRFDDDEFERVKAERLDEIARERDEPAIVADQALIAAIYGADLYGRPVRGTHESVGGLSVDAVRDFHSDRFAPGGALLIVCGDVRLDALAKGLERHFGGWSGACARDLPPAVPDVPVEGPGVILIDRPDSPQAELRVGTIGVPYGTDDHYSIIVANAILGGLFNSRINMNLREDKGWTYGARSNFRFRRGAGPFVARTAVETGATAPALREVLDEIDRMRKEPPDEDELLLAKHALTLSLPLQFETASQIARRVSTQLIYDLPGDYWERYRERIEAVTGDQVRRVCQTYLTDDRLVLLAVTDAAKVEDEVASLGPVQRRGTP
jgi:predicted Zn-dependent peptidase